LNIFLWLVFLEFRGRVGRDRSIWIKVSASLDAIRGITVKLGLEFLIRSEFWFAAFWANDIIGLTFLREAKHFVLVEAVAN
jgi:hypothetical protein